MARLRHLTRGSDAPDAVAAPPPPSHAQSDFYQHADSLVGVCKDHRNSGASKVLTLDLSAFADDAHGAPAATPRGSPVAVPRTASSSKRTAVSRATPKGKGKGKGKRHSRGSLAASATPVGGGVRSGGSRRPVASAAGDVDSDESDDLAFSHPVHEEGPALLRLQQSSTSAPGVPAAARRAGAPRVRVRARERHMHARDRSRA